MAKLSAVIATLSDVLAMPESAIESYAKPLRKAGLITSGPRGTAAPDIPPNQMAFCLIAILSGSPTHAVDKVISYSNLISDPDPSENELAFIANFDLEPGHTFLEMLTNVIHFYSEGSVFSRGAKAATEANIYPNGDMKKTFPPQWGPDPHKDHSELAALWESPWTDLTHQADVSVEIHEPLLGADVILSNFIFGPLSMKRRDDIEVHYHHPSVFNKEGPRLPDMTLSDLRRTSRVSSMTFLRLGFLLEEN